MAVGVRSSFDTQNEWAFGIFNIEAVGEVDAINKESKILSTLSHQDGPSPYVLNSWVCTYVSDDYLALAVTPAS